MFRKTIFKQVSQLSRAFRVAQPAGVSLFNCQQSSRAVVPTSPGHASHPHSPWGQCPVPCNQRCRRGWQVDAVRSNGRSASAQVQRRLKFNAVLARNGAQTGGAHAWLLHHLILAFFLQQPCVALALLIFVYGCQHSAHVRFSRVGSIQWRVGSTAQQLGLSLHIPLQGQQDAVCVLRGGSGFPVGFVFSTWSCCRCEPITLGASGWSSVGMPGVHLSFYVTGTAKRSEHMVCTKLSRYPQRSSRWTARGVCRWPG